MVDISYYIYYNDTRYRIEAITFWVNSAPTLMYHNRQYFMIYAVAKKLLILHIIWHVYYNTTETVYIFQNLQSIS